MPGLVHSILVAFASIRGRLAGTVNKLDDRHRRGVTGTRAGLENAQVTAGAVLEARTQLAEELAHCLFVAQAIEGTATMGDVVATRRSSLALGTVVRMVSCLINEALMFLNMARRCGLLRLSGRPELR